MTIYEYIQGKTGYLAGSPVNKSLSQIEISNPNLPDDVDTYEPVNPERLRLKRAVTTAVKMFDQLAPDYDSIMEQASQEANKIKIQRRLARQARA